jgi:hypothetical protein
MMHQLLPLLLLALVSSSPRRALTSTCVMVARQAVRLCGLSVSAAAAPVSPSDPKVHSLE